jgi:hypothetical protein
MNHSPGLRFYVSTLNKETEMPNAISVSIIINRPRSEVFAALIDLAKWPEWGGGNLVSMEQMSAGSLQAGSQIRQVNKLNGKLTEHLVHVTHFVPNQAFGIERPNLRGIFALEPAGTGTRLNARFEVDAVGVSALKYRFFLGPFVRNDLRKFKVLVEASAPTHQNL